MKHFKKRTIALVLASVVTVAGSFASANYKNTLMNLSLKSSSGGISVSVETKNAYGGNLTPLRKDAYTYVLTLPEVNSEAGQPNLNLVSKDVESVNIRTMPYSSNSEGYTRITIKTFKPSLNLTATNKIYIPPTPDRELLEDNKSNESKNNEELVRQNEELERYKKELEEKTKALEEIKAKEEARKKARSNNTSRIHYVDTQPKTKSAQNAVNSTNVKKQTTDVSTKSKKTSVKQEEKQEFNNLYFLALAILIILGSAFYVKKAFNNMDSLTGERIDISIDDDNSKKKMPKGTKRRKIKSTIQKLDNAYSKTATMAKPSEYTPAVEPAPKKEVEEILNVVDLDEVFSEQKAKNDTEISEEENLALEEFLSGFSFDEEYNALNETSEVVEEEKTFDEEFFEEVLVNNSLKFSTNDIECINKLLTIEILDSTLKNIDKYAISNPIKKIPTKQEILEELVTNYTIKQNLKFNSKDIEALNKLINVELDADFITDLRVNPQRTIEMEKEMEFLGDELRKPSEIVTISVKDLLPDLSEALKKQGNKAIESNFKPETVYYSQGYDVKTLSLGDGFPDLTTAIYEKNATEYKPTEEVVYADLSYEVPTLSQTVDLPDLEDVLANPEKYNEPEQEVVEVSEEDLLNKISNVQFKPFYDENQNIEILNDFEDDSNSEISSDVENIGVEDANILEEESIVETIEEDKFVPIKLERNFEPAPKDKNVLKKVSDDLIKKIEATKDERALRREKILNKKASIQQNSKAEIEEAKQLTKCILEGVSYTIVSSTNMIKNMGCHLAKGEEGYVVLGYIGDKIFKIRQYGELKSTKIQSRLSEKLSDNHYRYIVRIGMNKFILDVCDENIEYVMDL